MVTDAEETEKMIIGLTGSFSTGKTSVAGMFRKLGAKIIDADKIVHKFIDARTRRKLAKIVFKRKVYLELLCKIIHPLVIKEIKRDLRKIKSKKIVVVDAPLLIETGLHRIVDKLIVVKVNQHIQIQRAIRHTGLKKNDILRRIGFQMPLRKKIKLADWVVDNNGTISQTREQVIRIWKEISGGN